MFNYSITVLSIEWQTAGPSPFCTVLQLRWVCESVEWVLRHQVSLCLWTPLVPKHSPCILCITIKCNRLKLFLVHRILNKFHVTVRHSWKNVTCDMQTLFIWLKLHCFLQKSDCVFNTKGDQRVLQLGYKKLTYYITHAVIFWHILMQLQCIFSTFVLSCLCPKNSISWFDSQTMPQ